jgi:hypothetical protein
VLVQLAGRHAQALARVVADARKAELSVSLTSEKHFGNAPELAPPETLASSEIP